MPVEIQTPGASGQQVVQQDLRANTQQTVENLKILPAGTKVSEPLSGNNTTQLTNGQYPRMTLVTADTNVVGIAGTKVAGGAFSTRARVEAIRFTESVSLTATAQVTFVNCKFDQPITIPLNGRAAFVGCHFGVDSNVQNAPANIANVGIVGCTTIGPAPVNCTIIFMA